MCQTDPVRWLARFGARERRDSRRREAFLAKSAPRGRRQVQTWPSEARWIGLRPLARSRADRTKSGRPSTPALGSPRGNRRGDIGGTAWRGGEALGALREIHCPSSFRAPNPAASRGRPSRLVQVGAIAPRKTRSALPPLLSPRTLVRHLHWRSQSAECAEAARTISSAVRRSRQSSLGRLQALGPR